MGRAQLAGAQATLVVRSRRTSAVFRTDDCGSRLQDPPGSRHTRLTEATLCRAVWLDGEEQRHFGNGRSSEMSTVAPPKSASRRVSLWDAASSVAAAPMQMRKPDAIEKSLKPGRGPQALPVQGVVYSQ
jgi:hypothetical protein